MCDAEGDHPPVSMVEDGFSEEQNGGAGLGTSLHAAQEPFRYSMSAISTLARSACAIDSQLYRNHVEPAGLAVKVDDFANRQSAVAPSSVHVGLGQKRVETGRQQAGFVVSANDRADRHAGWALCR
jgi:hypothetical protein